MFWELDTFITAMVTGAAVLWCFMATDRVCELVKRLAEGEGIRMIWLLICTPVIMIWVAKTMHDWLRF